ncbi:MAG: DUF4388 domain-containing protein, partial [Planctomycetes bacterium]|nr:DUF4388 domain-containing protein [Planctomycetota bacterium]
AAAADEARTLRETLIRQKAEIEQMQRSNEQIRMRLEALQGDFSIRVADQEAEIRVRKEACEQSFVEAERLSQELRQAEQANKLLKSQNLDLQYHLNAYGIPVLSGSDFERNLLERAKIGQSRFFPAILPAMPGQDPVPIVLRGDLSAFHLASLLSFLANTNLFGVLTVLGQNSAAKLFIEEGALRLVAWNDRESLCSIPNLLVESDLLTEDEVATYREEKLYDLEVVMRLLYEGRLERDTLRACLLEYTHLIVTQLFEQEEGTFFLQQGTILFDKQLLFRLSITDLLLRTAAHVDQKQRQPQV